MREDITIATAGLLHETHTFLPTTTPQTEFERGCFRGDEIRSGVRDTNTPMSGFIRTCENADVSLEPVLHTHAGVSGLVESEAYEAYADEIHSQIGASRDDVDGVLLSLHGAAVTENNLSPEADLVCDLRSLVGDEVPIVVALDLHANLDPALVDAATAVCGYRSSPHVDRRETGRRAATILLDALAGDVEPTCAMTKPGLVIPSVFSATTVSPARKIIGRATNWELLPELLDVTRWGEREDILDVSFFFGFAWSDVPQLGATAVAVTDGTPDLAAEITDDLASFAWSHREALTKPDHLYDVPTGVERALERAESADDPVVLLDHADRLAETTYVLRELVEQDASNAAVPLLHDPGAVSICSEAGVGAEVEVAVGSKTSPRGGRPVEVTGTVEWVGDETYTATGPMTTGENVSNGETAILRAGGVWLQLTSQVDGIGLIDTDPFVQYGYDPTEFDVIVTKSKTHFRAVYEDLGEEIVIVDAPEYSSADLSHYDYEHVSADVYPLTNAADGPS